MPSGVYKRTESGINNMSKAHMGMKNALGHKCKHTKATKLKMSKAQKGIRPTKEARLKMSKAQSGKLSSQWLGGISFEPYSIEFNDQLKRKIRKRDKNICQLCRKRKYGKELDVHHIDYNKKNCKESNLIALCRKCNFKVNGGRDYWLTYFTYKMEKLNNV